MIHNIYIILNDYNYILSIYVYSRDVFPLKTKKFLNEVLVLCQKRTFFKITKKNEKGIIFKIHF